MCSSDLRAAVVEHRLRTPAKLARRWSKTPGILEALGLDDIDAEDVAAELGRLSVSDRKSVV